MLISIIPNQTIVATVACPLNSPILGEFETVLARKPPRIGELAGGSAGFVASIARFGISWIIEAAKLLQVSE
jgi:hypothetical protein